MKHERYPILFDPQTAGGLLAAVPQAQVEHCLLELHGLGYRAAAIIGSVRGPFPDSEPILIVF
jgi:selenide,water dikinase